MTGVGRLGAAVLVVADGGASGCRLAAFDAGGRRLAQVSVESPASLTLGEVAAWSTLRRGIDALARTLSDVPVRTGAVVAAPADGVPADGALAWTPSRLVFGLAGALQDERRERLLALVHRDTGGASRCHVVTDGHAQLVGASGGRPGVCLAIGTGSVLHWLDEDGAGGMAGGWGFPVGDEGSGAWLGARLLRHYVWHRDGERCDSSLMDALDARTGGDVSAIQRLTTESRSTVHAALARLVVEADAAGDALAVSLLDGGAEWCLRLVGRAPATLPVHLVGGLADAYASRLGPQLGERLRDPCGDALDGLNVIARERTT